MDIYYWHFAADTLRDGLPLPEPGVWLPAISNVKLCRSGYHASKSALDALKYAPGTNVALVQMRDIEYRASDKVVARQRCAPYGYRDAKAVLLKFARQCAIDVVYLWDPPDIVLKFLRGETNSAVTVVAVADAALDCKADADAAAAAAYAAEAARAAARAAEAARAAARAADAAYAAGNAADAAYAAANVARDTVYAAAAADAAHAAGSHTRLRMHETGAADDDAAFNDDTSFDAAFEAAERNQAARLHTMLMELFSEHEVIKDATPGPNDGTDALCRALYQRDARPADYLGGSDAAMLHDAASRIAELEDERDVFQHTLDKRTRERDEAKAIAMHETEVARNEVKARGAIFTEHKLMRQTLQAIGEEVLCPGNWHPTELIACRGMVKAIRENEKERAKLKQRIAELEQQLRERPYRDGASRIDELEREIAELRKRPTSR